MPFNFQYAVNDVETANDYTHNAVSDGDVTRGEYRVQLPDGRTQIVKYTADWKNGYNAVVMQCFMAIIINYLQTKNRTKNRNLMKFILSPLQVSYEGEARFPDAPVGASNQGYKY